MLSCEKLSVRLGANKSLILDSVSATFKAGAMNAVIGPSGCGKTTLVKSMLGLLPHDGQVYLKGAEVQGSAELLGKVAFAPQFSIAHPQLSVEEVLKYSLDLFVLDASIREERLEAILDRIGLSDKRTTRVASLSGGQLRRLGLGLELVGDPDGMVCDEVTSGLDPLSEDQILEMLQSLRDERGKTFICIIHNLAKLDYFDLITVVYKGAVVFQGSLQELMDYFEISDALHLYDILNGREVGEWRAKWDAKGEAKTKLIEKAESAEAVSMPSLMSQLATLLKRRSLLFVRDRGYWMLTLGITLGFPFLVTIFAMDGLPELRGLAMSSAGGFFEQLEDNLRFRIDALETASLVTGLILFQVILLTLIGSNNGAREIAGERVLYEKERFSGVSPTSYALSKLLFTSSIALVQGLWMTLFVKYVCDFPGPFLPQASILMLSCVSMTIVCLGFSAILGSADKASLISVYLVGFQLPLSGVVLALPEALVWVCRPFINAYWGWAGYFGSMISTRFYDAYRLESSDYIPVPATAALVLLVHCAIGAGIVFWGCQQKRSI
jgi:ABC-type multidrug transport system ATPase subunit